MEKLKLNQIQFIDNYLKNSDVIFDDIRLEMVDHVATVIEREMNNGDEREFYYIFKEYMVENKKQLLDNNKKFIKKSTNKVGKHILRNAFSIKGFLVLIIMSLGLYFLYNIIDLKSFNRVLIYAPIAILLISVLGIKFYRVNRKPFRFSAINQLSLYSILIYQTSYIFFNPFNSSSIKKVLSIEMYYATLLVLCYISIMFMLTAFQLSNYYTKKYRKILAA